MGTTALNPRTPTFDHTTLCLDPVPALAQHKPATTVWQQQATVADGRRSAGVCIDDTHSATTSSCLNLLLRLCLCVFVSLNSMHPTARRLLRCWPTMRAGLPLWMRPMSCWVWTPPPSPAWSSTCRWVVGCVCDTGSECVIRGVRRRCAGVQVGCGLCVIRGVRV